MAIYISSLKKIYAANANAKNAAGAKAYMRNQFEYFGMETTLRRDVSKEFIKQQGIPEIPKLTMIVKELWKMPQRDFQYFAQEILEKKIKTLQPKDIGLLEFMVMHKSWWDTVDFIAPKLIGVFFKNYPHLILPKTKEWIKSKNIWLMRSALLFQLKYKKQTDEKLLFSIIQKCAHEKDFFIRKAIGWVLREHSKTFPQSVTKFVKENEQILSPLSKKEALRRIN